MSLSLSLDACEMVSTHAHTRFTPSMPVGPPACVSWKKAARLFVRMFEKPGLFEHNPRTLRKNREFACLRACLLVSLFVCLFACLLACLIACLWFFPHFLFACFIVCFLFCLFACLFACLARSIFMQPTLPPTPPPAHPPPHRKIPRWLPGWILHNFWPTAKAKNVSWDQQFGVSTLISLVQRECAGSMCTQIT